MGDRWEIEGVVRYLDLGWTGPHRHVGGKLAMGAHHQVVNLKELSVPYPILSLLIACRIVGYR